MDATDRPNSQSPIKAGATRPCPDCLQIGGPGLVGAFQVAVNPSDQASELATVWRCQTKDVGDRHVAWINEVCRSCGNLPRTEIMSDCWLCEPCIGDLADIEDLDELASVLADWNRPITDLARGEAIRKKCRAWRELDPREWPAQEHR